MMAANYSRGVRIGNWNEEAAVDEEIIKDFEMKKQRGRLLLKQRERQEAIANQRVPHSYSKDGFVHFGFTVMLRVDHEDEFGHKESRYLANSLWEDLDPRDRTKVVSAGPRDDPIARNTFVIVEPGVAEPAAGMAAGAPPPGHTKSRRGRERLRPAEGDRVLHFGERFLLATNPSLRVDPVNHVAAPPYFLVTDRANNVLGKGSGSQQQVGVGPSAGALAQWMIIPASGDRLASEGLPVPVDTPIEVVHCSTNQPLGSTPKKHVHTTFGAEWEVHAEFHAPAAHIPPGRSRPALEPNRWHIITAERPEDAVDRRDFGPVTMEYLLGKVREALRARGVRGIRCIARTFRILDDRGDHKLDREDLQWGLYDFGVHLTDEEFEFVLNGFDRDGDGVVDLDEFLRVMRCPLSDRRQQLIRAAFNTLDVDGSGEVTVADVGQIYDVSGDPDVENGAKSEEEALREFMDQWDTHDKDGIITPAEFQEYFEDVSASIDTDDYFEHMMRATWHLTDDDIEAVATGGRGTARAGAGSG